VVTHRVVSIAMNGNGSHTVQTKGDANTANDPWTATLVGDHVWQVRAVIPRIGTAIRALRDPDVGRLLRIGAPTAFVLLALGSIWRTTGNGPTRPAQPGPPARPGSSAQPGSSARRGRRAQTSRTQTSRAQTSRHAKPGRSDHTKPSGQRLPAALAQTSGPEPSGGIGHDLEGRVHPGEPGGFAHAGHSERSTPLAQAGHPGPPAQPGQLR